MSTVPKNIVERIAWLQEHAALWVLNQVALGIAPARATLMATKATAAADTLSEQAAALTAAKGKTIAMHAALDEASRLSSELLKEIRAAAAAAPDGGSAIYELAGIAGPTPPSPVGAPGKATDFKVTLADDGSVTLGWACANPGNARGTVYQVARQLGGAGQPSIILGATGEREFVDDTLPANSGPVVYSITAIRSTRKGPVAEFTVKFGTGSGGAMTATIVSAPKLAA